MKEKLVFDSNFGRGSIDLSLWSYEVAGHGFGNNELQYYTDRKENSFVDEKGCLNIVARKEKYENRDYTSAKLTTFKKFSFQYGRVEYECQIPMGLGTWPAIWMLSNAIQEGMPWPLAGEIDLMENVGKLGEQIHFSLHSKANNHVIGTQLTYFEDVKNCSKEMKKYAMEWSRESISYFIEDKKVCEFKRTINKDEENMEKWPFDQEFYLILNYAIGGNWGGKVDDSIFPSTFLVKSVKVYQYE